MGVRRTVVQVVVLDNPALPDLLIDTALAAACGMWTYRRSLYYALRPDMALSGPHDALPVQHMGATIFGHISTGRIPIAWPHVAPNWLVFGGEIANCGVTEESASSESSPKAVGPYNTQGTCLMTSGHETHGGAVKAWSDGFNAAAGGQVPSYSDQRKLAMQRGRKWPIKIENCLQHY
jgi:hypothetical protein